MSDKVERRTLSYSTSSFDAVVCLNGVIPSREMFELLAAVPLVAADGAANRLLEVGVGPEFIVGDIDSVTEETLSAFEGTSEIIVDNNQDTTDFEKCLVFASTQLWTKVLVVGMHGGELEHTLNNWSVFMRHGREMMLTAFDDGRYATPLYESFDYSPSKDELISLIPQPNARVSTEGLKWNLSDESLSLGTREGARNRSVGGMVKVDLHDGSLLFFCESRLPIAPSTDGVSLPSGQEPSTKS